MAESTDRPKREGVINLWRSAREMQIWCEVEDGDYTMRKIGDHFSLRKRVGAEKVLLHFDAPRPYWDEMLTRANFWGAALNLGVFTVPRETVVKLLAMIDKRMPALVKDASKAAAVTQARMEAEKAEEGERLPMAE